MRETDTTQWFIVIIRHAMMQTNIHCTSVSSTEGWVFLPDLGLNGEWCVVVIHTSLAKYDW